MKLFVFARFRARAGQEQALEALLTRISHRM